MKVIDGGTKRKYYKWSEPNATIVGNPTIEKGVVSGFSLSNYLELPQQFKPDSNTWEIVFKFIDIGDGGWIFSSGYFGESNYVTNVHIDFRAGESKVRGSFGFGYGNNYYGLTAPISTTGVQYVKISWNGSQYAIFVSNTSTFSDTPTSYWNSSTAVSQSPIWAKTRIGMLHTGVAGYTGKIDFTESYIKIGGNLWWQGCSIEEADETDYDWYEDVEVSEVVEGEQETITTWENWVSPYLTSNSSYGMISGDFNYTWFNGAQGQGVTRTRGNQHYTAYWEFPESIKLSTVYWFYKQNPDRYAAAGTMEFYSVDSNNVETSIGRVAWYEGGSGSQTLDDSIEVTKLKVVYYGDWAGANGMFALPISFDGYVKTTKTYTPLYAVRN